MKLTARQRKFLEVARDGACPWAMPKGGPYLRNEEIRPLIDAGLIEFDERIDCWVLSPPRSPAESKGAAE